MQISVSQVLSNISDVLGQLHIRLLTIEDRRESNAGFFHEQDCLLQVIHFHLTAHVHEG